VQKGLARKAAKPLEEREEAAGFPSLIRTPGGDCGFEPESLTLWRLGDLA
jgi:hypothetical protein